MKVDSSMDQKSLLFNILLIYSSCLSSLKDERVKASKVLHGPPPSKYSGNKKLFIEAIKDAIYASKIISYAQVSAMLIFSVYFIIVFFFVLIFFISTF